MNNTQTSNSPFLHYLPHIVAVIAFLIISLIYCSPVLNNKELVGSDVESWMGMSQEAKVFNDSHDEGTLWTNSMFGGMPTYQILNKSKKDFFYYTIGLTLYKLPRVVFTIFLYLLGFYIFLLCFRVNPWLSMALSAAFAFCSYNLIILAVGHDTKALSIAYMPAVIGSVIFAFRRNRWVGAVLTVIFLGLQIRSNHLQITYYTLFILICYGISELVFSVREKTLPQMFKTFGILIVAALVAIGMNATSLMTTHEYSKYTMRGPSNGLTAAVDSTSIEDGLDRDYITSWSYGIKESMTLLIPNFMGGPSSQKLSGDSHTAARLRQLSGDAYTAQLMKETPMPTYWGNQAFTAGPVYAGAIVCFLALLGLLIVPGRNRWWLFGAFLLGILLAWGRNFMPLTDFFISYVPLYNMFRTVSMTLVISCFALAALAALALKEWFFNEQLTQQKKQRALLISGGITAFVCLLFGLVPSLAGDFKASIDTSLTQYGYPDFFVSTLQADRADLLSSDALRSFFFIALTAGLLFLSLRFKRLAQSPLSFIIIGILILADLVPVARRYLNDDNFTAKRYGSRFEPSYADEQVLKDPSYYRVLDLTVNVFNSAHPAYFHKCIGGYHAAKLRRYQELINVHLSREIANIGASFHVLNHTPAEQQQQVLSTTFAQNHVLNMLNMKYVIYNREADPLVNPFANGPAWFVQQAVVVDSPDEEMLALGHMDNKHSLVVDQRCAGLVPSALCNRKGQPATLPAADTSATINLTSYEPNCLKYHTESKTQQLAVFSEIFYDKGWNAYVDGVKADYFRANYLLRAMVIEPGSHDIEFRFEPSSWTIGNYIRSVCSVLLTLAIIVLVILHVRKRQGKTSVK